MQLQSQRCLLQLKQLSLNVLLIKSQQQVAMDIPMDLVVIATKFTSGH
jgi:hypothetical protein